jgi:hypothetical protein
VPVGVVPLLGSRNAAEAPPLLHRQTSPTSSAANAVRDSNSGRYGSPLHLLHRVKQRNRVPVSVEIGGSPGGATAIATSTNSGMSWRTRLVPGPLHYGRVDLIDMRHWRLSDGSSLLATDDAGRHWQRWTSLVKMKDSVGTTLALNFLSPRLGFAVPDANAGPLWWAHDGGTTWKAVKITAGPFTLPR